MQTFSHKTTGIVCSHVFGTHLQNKKDASTCILMYAYLTIFSIMYLLSPSTDSTMYKKKYFVTANME